MASRLFYDSLVCRLGVGFVALGVAVGLLFWAVEARSRSTSPYRHPVGITRGVQLREWAGFILIAPLCAALFGFVALVVGAVAGWP